MQIAHTQGLCLCACVCEVECVCYALTQLEMCQARQQKQQQRELKIITSFKVLNIRYPRKSIVFTKQYK